MWFSQLFLINLPQKGPNKKLYQSLYKNKYFYNSELQEKHEIHCNLLFWTRLSLQAMANGFDLNMENNIWKRDTQFISKFWLKTLENQMKYILPCILLEHTGGINLCFGMEHGFKCGKKRHNVFVRCFSTNNWNIIIQIYQIRQFL